MALTVAVNRKLYHHRNPSGLHNKIRWLLTETRYKVDVLDELSCMVIGTPSWETAFWITEKIITKHFTEIRERYPQHWQWAKKYVNIEREWQLKNCRKGEKK